MLSHKEDSRNHWAALDTLAEVASSEVGLEDDDYMPSDALGGSSDSRIVFKESHRIQPIKRTTKPTYASIIGSAILAQPEQKAKVNVICEWMARMYPQDFSVGDKKWESAVRYNCKYLFKNRRN
jgi:hypothetical protein